MTSNWNQSRFDSEGDDYRWTNGSAATSVVNGTMYLGWVHQHEKYRFKYAVEGVAATCIAVFGVVGNVFTLLTLVRQRPRTSTVVYLLSLAVTDLIFLVTQTFYWSLRSIYDCDWTRTVAKFTYQIHYINLLINIWLVVCVSVDRYIAVCHPHRMATMCNVPKATKVVGLIVFGAVLYNAPRFGEIIDTVRTPTKIDRLYILIYKLWMYCGFYAVSPLLILLVLNAFIIYALRKRHLVKMRLTSHGSSSSESSRKKVKTDTHVNVICVGVVILFLVCQLPFIVATIIWALSYQGSILTTPTDSNKRNWLIDLNSVAIMSATINSATNFLLYCAFSSGFRKTFLEVIHIRGTKKRWDISGKKPSSKKNTLFAQDDFSPVSKGDKKTNPTLAVEETLSTSVEVKSQNADEVRQIQKGQKENELRPKSHKTNGQCQNSVEAGTIAAAVTVELNSETVATL